MFIAKNYENKTLKKAVKEEKTSIVPQNFMEVIGTGASKVEKCFESLSLQPKITSSFGSNKTIGLPKISSRRSPLHEKKSKGKESLESFILVQSIASPLLTFSSSNMNRRINVVNKDS